MTAPEATAQTGAHTNVSFAVAGGLNAAHLPLPFDELPQTEVNVTNRNRLGFIGGALIDLGRSSRVAFETGALVSGRGGTVDMTVPGFLSAKVVMRMIYLEIPALARVPVAVSGNSRVSLLAGATTAFRLHARARGTFNGETEDTTFTDDVAAVDFGLTFGGRADFGRALVQAVYTFGLTDAAHGDGPGPVRHRVFSGMVGWKF
jgi:hypothetical protein